MEGVVLRFPISDDVGFLVGSGTGGYVEFGRACVVDGAVAVIIYAATTNVLAGIYLPNGWKRVMVVIQNLHSIYSGP